MQMSADLGNPKRPREGGGKKFSGHPCSSPWQRGGMTDEADTTVLAQAPKPRETLHK